MVLINFKKVFVCIVNKNRSVLVYFICLRLVFFKVYLVLLEWNSKYCCMCKF